MKCKNCGEEIIKRNIIWYHEKTIRYYCEPTHAEPTEEKV